MTTAAATARRWFEQLRSRRHPSPATNSKLLDVSNFVVFGGIWIGPGGGAERGDGDRPDLGQDNANDTIRTAFEAGVREFDTAPWYGSGASEERLGKAIRSLPEEMRREVKVSTKVGRIVLEPETSRGVLGTGKEETVEERRLRLKPVLGGLDDPINGTRPSDRIVVNDYTSDGVYDGLRHSLSRMGLDRVHCLRLHDANDNNLNRRPRAGAVTSDGDSASSFVDEVAIALDETHGALAALRRLRDDDGGGAISQIGLGMNCNAEPHMGVPDEILRLLRSAPIGTFDHALLAGGWNLLNQDGLECYARCESMGLPVHAAGVFASGLLAAAAPRDLDDVAEEEEDGHGTAAHRALTYAYRPATSDSIDRARQWRDVANGRGLSLQSVAIAFASLPPCVSKVCLGMATPDQVRQTLSWVEEASEVPYDVWDEARDKGLLNF